MTGDPAHANRQLSLEFITGYLVEEALSVDNLFVFLLIFRYFKVPSGVATQGAVLGHTRRDPDARRFHRRWSHAAEPLPLGDISVRSLPGLCRHQVALPAR